jgi:transcriptional regulator with XRE-family HTH domain
VSDATITVPLGLIICQRREALGLSQEGLAALAELNRNYIGKIERGEVSASVISLQKIADGLNLKLSELLSLYEQEGLSHKN